MPFLTLLRHGQSQWNLENRFTGWVDVDLTAQGEAQARRSGELLAASGVPFDKLFTSVQTRAIRTGSLATEAAKLAWLPVARDWRLNERHYGALTGLNKAETAAKHGEAAGERLAALLRCAAAAAGSRWGVRSLQRSPVCWSERAGRRSLEADP